jgi:hypothetical protein
MPRTEEYREGAPQQGLPPTYPGMPATQPLDPVTGGAPPAPPAVTARPRQSGWQQAHAEMFAATESHAAPWRPGPAPQRQAAAPPPTGKLVVLSGGLGPWRQGEVIEAKWLEAFPGADLQRLYDVEAVRPADEREAAQERVTLPGTAGATPLELQLADRDRRLGEQAQEVVRLRDELRAAKQQGPGQPQAPGPQGVDPGLIAEKDKAIKDLQRQLEEARGQQAAQQEEGRGRKGK